MLEAYVIACAGVGLILFVSMVGGSILALLEIIHDKFNKRSD